MKRPIRAVSEYLGHADPGFTLRTYTHLMAGSSQRTKRAIDAVFGVHSGADDDVVEDEDAEDLVDSDEPLGDDLDEGEDSA